MIVRAYIFGMHCDNMFSRILMLQAPSSYLIQCWLGSAMAFGISRMEWVKQLWYSYFSLSAGKYGLTGMSFLTLPVYSTEYMGNLYQTLPVDALDFCQVASRHHIDHMSWLCPCFPLCPCFEFVQLASFHIEAWDDLQLYMGQVTKLQLSCYLVLLSIDSKTS